MRVGRSPEELAKEPRAVGAIVSPGITIWGAVGTDTSLTFRLIDSLVLMPIILADTAYSYWVFRSKVDSE